MSDANAGRKAGFKWGPFTLRIPFLQARWCWPEGLQGVLVAAATLWVSVAPGWRSLQDKQ